MVQNYFWRRIVIILKQRFNELNPLQFFFQVSNFWYEPISSPEQLLSRQDDESKKILTLIFWANIYFLLSSSWLLSSY